MKRHGWMLAALAAVLLVSAQAEAARQFWTLGFTHTDLRYVTVCGKQYAYLTYEVTNKTGESRAFAPIFRVETDTRRTTYAMPAADVAAAVRAKQGKNVLDINQMTGPIADGETKVGVAVFYNLDPEADHVTVYVTGLTDAFRYQDEDARKGFQRMMWKIDWYRPGDAANRALVPVQTTFDECVWRSTGIAGTAEAAVSEEPVRAQPEPPAKPAKPAEAPKPAEAAPAPAAAPAAPAAE